MNHTQTNPLNPNASPVGSLGSAVSAKGSRWRALFAPSILLLICPAVMLIFGFIILGYMRPIYAGLSGLDYDPAYQYLFNGAGLIRGYVPAHTDHPGTPAQMLIGLITIVSWSIARLFGLTSMVFPQSIAAYPEQYLGVILSAFLIMNSMAVYAVGMAVAKSTRIVTAGVACQAAYLFVGELFPRVFDAAPEAVLFLAGTGLMATLAPVIMGNEECSDRRAIAVGFFVGLGTACKVNFSPLFLLVFLLRRPLTIFKAGVAGVFFMFLFVSPIIRQLGGVLNWLMLMARHQGGYGQGPEGFIDWSAVPERARTIAAAEPFLAVAAVALVAALLFSKPRDKWTAAVMSLAGGVEVFLVLKQFAIHYLMPVVAIAPVVIIWGLSRFGRRPYPYVLAAAFALALGATSLQEMSSAFAKERALRSENQKAIDEVLARYKDPVVVGAYRSGYKHWALQFGIAWANQRFAALIPNATADDSLWYDSGQKNIWRNSAGAVPWSYLDQFEKAGRAVLIVQPRGTKIAQKTARTETLLDQGFGNTVERIIVPAISGEN
jgi:hypothetical protein